MSRTQLWLVIAAIAVIAATAILLTGRSAAPAPAGRSDAGGNDVLILVTGTGNEARPRLPDAGRVLLHELALRQDYRDGDPPLAVVLGIDGDGSVRPEKVDLTPRRGNDPGGDIENNPRRREAAAARAVDEVDRLVQNVVATKSGHALLAGLQLAGRRSEGTIVICSSGVDTTSPVDLRLLGFDYPARKLVDHLRTVNALPALDGRRVLLALSPADRPQQPLNEPARRGLEASWTAVLRAAGATVQPVASASDEPSTGAVGTPSVPVPEIPSPRRDPRGTIYVLPAAVLFVPDSAGLLDAAAARAALLKIAAEVRGRRVVLDITGHTALDRDGWAAGRPLSLARARVIERLLVRLGVPPTAVRSVRGVGPRQPLRVPATDPRNRAVVVVATPLP